jgi:tetratricopeptide (TPR) repeat protein
LSETAIPTTRGLALSWQKSIAIALLILAVLAVYRDSFKGVFVFDDVPAIVENPTLRPPVHWRDVLLPPGDQAGTVGGRPLVNATLALNYAFGGLNVEGYHAVNVAIHLGATLLLFGIISRTLARRSRREGRSGASDADAFALWTAFLIALLWAVHPLQTESVTYIVQRAESLMGLFYLLTLYSFIRSAETTTPKFVWSVLMLTACFLGMLTKEVMVTAPLTILLYDVVFVGGSFMAAWRVRRLLYIGLAATWIVLGLLVISTHGRGGSAGFGSAPAWPYLLTQARAMTHYLALAFWPAHLVFDYGTGLIRDVGDVALRAAFLIFLLAASVYALRKSAAASGAGFLGLVFFLLLAPSSSLLPIATEPQAEHRMYLPLAVVIAFVVLAVARALAKFLPRFFGVVFGGLGVAAALALGHATVLRNRDYRSEIALWTSTVQNAPRNPRAHNNLAQALLAAKEPNRAFGEFSAAVAIDPDYVPAQYNLGAMLLDARRPKEAIPHLEKALSAPRHQTEIHLYLGEAYEQVGRSHDAIEAFRAALQIDPKNAEAAFGLGNNLAREGNLPGAVEAFRLAVKNAPDQVQIRNNLANALAFSGHLEEAIIQYREALARDPANAQIRENLEGAEALLGARR